MGVRSTAILFGTWIRPLLILCALGFVGMLAAAGHVNNQGIPYFVLSVGGTAVHMVWQFMTVDLAVPTSCWGACAFLSASVAGLKSPLYRKFQSKRATGMDRMGRFDGRLSPGDGASTDA